MIETADLERIGAEIIANTPPEGVNASEWCDRAGISYEALAYVHVGVDNVLLEKIAQCDGDLRKAVAHIVFHTFRLGFEAGREYRPEVRL